MPPNSNSACRKHRRRHVRPGHGHSAARESGLCNKTALKADLENKLVCGFLHIYIFLKQTGDFFLAPLSRLSASNWMNPRSVPKLSHFVCFLFTPGSEASRFKGKKIKLQKKRKKKFSQLPLSVQFFNLHE